VWLLIAGALLALVVAFSTVRFDWLSRRGDSQPTPPAAVAPPQAKSADNARTEPPAKAAADIIGFVDVPLSESAVGNEITVSGWALAAAGIQRVEVRIDGHAYEARYAIPSPDVAIAKPGYPDAAAARFSYQFGTTELTASRHAMEVVAVDKRGQTFKLAQKSVIPPRAFVQWNRELDSRPELRKEQFYFLMMTSGITRDVATEVRSHYVDYVSRTQKIGISVPILYLRTTRGADHDWLFDPNFDLSHKCGDRPVAEDNLATVIRFAIESRTPVQFILNGGIWGDASCETPQWDITDHLEQDRVNCQWDQHDRVYPDGFLKGLPGSTASPELARSLTYSVYARAVREYKRRNLQAAARMIAAFARREPDLFVGVVLDADTYMNPFLRPSSIFDYNPWMLRQFREWLSATGPYAGKPASGAPDLSSYRRATPLSLARVNAIARQNWKSWSDVEPPRSTPGLADPLRAGGRPIWEDPWWNLWDEFRKHIVDLHYDELSTWVRQSGVPRDAIFSAQGLIHDDPSRPAFSLRVASASSSYDSAGVSVEGAVPRDGHLGAVLYGHTARNDVTLENGRSLFATIGRMDDGWGIVEYNNTDMSQPYVPPNYAMAYQTFRDAFNYGAREVSAMAWNGSNGMFLGTPGYVPFTAWRNTAAEDAMRDYLVAHADLPRGARLWTFGTPVHADADGWSAEHGLLTAHPGFATLQGDRGSVTLLSPPDQLILPARIDRLLMRFENNAAPMRVTVAAQPGPASPWTTVGDASGNEVLLHWPTRWKNDSTIVERLRIELKFAPGAESFALSDIVLYPNARRAVSVVRRTTGAATTH
jgi:hypothetical protein